ncbi:MBL fold metallo-hydrolase [Pedobacter sp. CFBP9032]|uniref:MBL fold metallo-hydrolase n=1 Tax=Pedobacter sp. CFBP9032 TaxID=3096539 RepID=UPI002A6AA255|nr:MBL fold metallo-hydrolase [Pedobacter sp. CFBP9032]MDY0906503.1 MBL fold metallo-hydrolase [Pedobacter sp. CFBP9032]
MSVIALTLGNYTVNKSKKFSLIDSSSTGSGAKVAIQPFLVTTKKDVILLDTGINLDQGGLPPVCQRLTDEGIDPEQVTKVLISHLHKDHIDGIGYFSDGEFISSFPNATIYIQQRELDFALAQEGNPSYRPEMLEQLALLPNVVLLNDDQGNITDEISYEVSGGHTPNHQVFWIKENGETIFYGADNLPQRNYLKFQVAFKNDFDGRKALEARQKWEEEGKEQQWTVLLYHDMENATIRF